MTTMKHSFISSGLTSIIALGSYSSTPLSRWHLVPLYLHHRVGSISTYKSERYSIERISGMIQDDEGEQESDDKDQRR